MIEFLVFECAPWARHFPARRRGCGVEIQLGGDPASPASAPLKLHRSGGRFREEILFPGRRFRDASLLHTHRKSEERVRRLRDFVPEPSESAPPGGPGPLEITPRHPVVSRRQC